MNANGTPEDIKFLASVMNDLGSERTYNHYPVVTCPVF
jgi:hypothetical protein